MRYVLQILLIALSSVTGFGQINLSSSLTACYALNGNANDPINNLTGTLSAVTPTVDRNNNPNSAYSFNGTASSYIKLPNSGLLKSNSVSFSCWVRFNNVSNGQFIAFVYNGCVSYQEGYQLGLTVSGSPRFQIAKANNSCAPQGQAILNSISTVSPQTWYHIGFYAGPDSLKLYVNGSLSSVLANSNSMTYGSGVNVYLGGSVGANINLPMYGSIDNARFYNRKLNGAEMFQLYSTDPECISTIGLFENTVSESFAVYPNPANGKFTVDFAEGLENEVKIYNVFGEVFHTRYTDGAQTRFDISDQPDGIYFLEIKVGGRLATKKIIKVEDHN